jgi:GNAT superfamily N-acetyltransferase
MITVRRAILKDAEAITGFQLAMALETEALRLDNETVTRGVLAVFADKSKGEYFVAESEDGIIASLLITYEWSDWRNSNVWWFQSVYVIPVWRRKGVFSLMYQYIRDEAEKLGIAGLRLYVETGNSAAQKTYEAMGMTREHYTMYEWLK